MGQMRSRDRLLRRKYLPNRIYILHIHGTDEKWRQTAAKEIPPESNLYIAYSWDR